MKQLPFDKAGRFWRGNLHGHSTLSDGGFSPEEVCRRYQEAGYDFISLTDHFLSHYDFPMADTRAFRNAEFTTIIGAELHAGQTELGGIWHILAVGLPFDFAQPHVDESGPEIAARALATGAFVAAAHPQWYALTERDLEALGSVDAIEIYNGVAIDHNDRADSWHIADIMLGRGNRYLTYAADDFHGVRGRHDFVRGWAWAMAEENSPEALLKALKAGHFYSSTGPQIFDVQVRTGREIVVRCSPVDWVMVTGKGPAAVTASGHGLSEVSLDISKFKSNYGRITVRDAMGGRAWSNPFWFDEE
jgi:predicted metal-dependent phosphoesterase TrpH